MNASACHLPVAWRTPYVEVINFRIELRRQSADQTSLPGTQVQVNQETQNLHIYLASMASSLWTNKCLPIQVVVLIRLHSGTTRLGDYSPIQLLIFLC